MLESILNLIFVQPHPFTFQECNLQSVWFVSLPSEMEVVKFGLVA